MSRNLPDVQAIDPDNCGCTECIIGEYAQEGVWHARANAYDLAALLNGEVRNNTHGRFLDFVQLWVYTDESAIRFCELFMDELNEMLEAGRAFNIADPDQLAARATW